MNNNATTSSLSESLSSLSHGIKTARLTIDIQNELGVLYLLYVKRIISNHFNGEVVVLLRDIYLNVYVLVDAEQILNFFIGMYPLERAFSLTNIACDIAVRDTYL